MVTSRGKLAMENRVNSEKPSAVFDCDGNPEPSQPKAFRRLEGAETRV
jgi:hypothetical protein